VGNEREPYRVLVRADGPRRVRLVATSLEATDAAVGRVRNALLIGSATAVVVAGIGGWVLAATALRPVERMRRTAADISEHDVSARLPVPATHDELQALATTMNALLAELHDALKRQGAFVADAGHELRTPLAVLRAELELAGRPTRTRDELRDAVEHAARETDRLESLAQGLLFLAKRDEGADAHFEVTPLAPMLEAAVDASQGQAREQQVHIALDADGPVTARVAPSLLRPAVDNLLGNALRHSPPASTVTVRLRGADACTVIEVLDEGAGFPPGFLAQAFERFSRADSARGRCGAGLGLAIVRAVAEVHGGSTAAANRPEGGAVVTIRIPTSV
jgi:signal transduction histidine kinase